MSQLRHHYVIITSRLRHDYALTKMTKATLNNLRDFFIDFFTFEKITSKNGVKFSYSTWVTTYRLARLNKICDKCPFNTSEDTVNDCAVTANINWTLTKIL